MLLSILFPHSVAAKYSELASRSLGLTEATMSHPYPMHHQQLPPLDLAWLIVAVVFITLVAVPGALTLLALLLSEFIL